MYNSTNSVRVSFELAAFELSKQSRAYNNNNNCHHQKVNRRLRADYGFPLRNLTVSGSLDMYQGERHELKKCIYNAIIWTICNDSDFVAFKVEKPNLKCSLQLCWLRSPASLSDKNVEYVPLLFLRVHKNCSIAQQ